MNEENLLTQITKIKKVELHRHVEGCISPELFHKLVKKHEPNSVYTDFHKVTELYNYRDFMGFLNAFDTVVSFLQDYDDFKQLAETVVTQLREDNVIYAELIFSPQPFLRKGMDLEKILNTMYNVFCNSKIHTSIIIDFVRNFGVEEAHETLEIITKIRQANENLKKWIKAVSIGGDEVNFPAKLFKEVFEKAKGAELNCYAHAGESVGAESVWDALKLLKAQRIGHGIHSVEDKKLMKYLETKHIGLDVSITSNYSTDSVNKGHKHPVKELFRKNILISLNTDDPGFFHTNLNNECFIFCNMGFTISDLKKVQIDAMNISFLEDREKKRIIKLITDIKQKLIQ